LFLFEDKTRGAIQGNREYAAGIEGRVCRQKGEIKFYKNF
jgi:hypothetical protein